MPLIFQGENLPADIHSPQRIISLVPSQTELLFDLGLGEKVMAITKFCIHPNEWFRTKQRVGGTKNVKIDMVRSLKPDLVLGNKEENVKEQLETIADFAPVWVSDISNLEQALEMIGNIGILTNTEDKAWDIASGIREGFQQLKPISPLLRTAYLIWREPYMAAAGDTFISNIMARCGLVNVLQHSTRYPEVTIGKDITSDNCDLLLLSSEPYPFKQKHIDELQAQLPGVKICLVDGEMFSWYGSRLLQAPGYCSELLSIIANHPSTQE